MSRYSTVTKAEFQAAVGSFLVYLASVDDVRQLSQSEFLSWIQSQFTSEDFKKNLYTVADGFNLVVTDDGNASGDYRWVVLRPTSALATGTIVLPTPDEANDGQEILVTTTRQIVSFTVDGNGALELNGAPNVLAAGDKFKLKYESQTKSWNAIV